MRTLTPEALREFARRRWDLVERSKREFAAHRFRTGGYVASRAAAQRLLQKWQTLHPEGPLPAMRADDLAAHLQLKRKLDQTPNGRRGR